MRKDDLIIGNGLVSDGPITQYLGKNLIVTPNGKTRDPSQVYDQVVGEVPGYVAIAAAQEPAKKPCETPAQSNKIYISLEALKAIGNQV